VLTSLENGQIPQIGVLQGGKPYSGVRVKPPADWIQAAGVHLEGLSVADFARRTRMSLSKASRIIETGIVVAHKGRFPGKRTSQRIIPLEQVERFQSRFVTTGGLSDLIGETRRTIRTRIRLCDLKPSSQDVKVDAPFFDWQEVEQKLVCRWPKHP